MRRLEGRSLVIDLDSVDVDGVRQAVTSNAIRSSAGGRRDGVGADRRTGEFADGGSVVGAIIGAIAGDAHLRSTHDVSGQTIEASDGEIGHVEDFVIDDQSWSIGYLIVATRNWLPGKKVIISSEWVERIDWEEGKVQINLTRDAVQHAPGFSADALITRACESTLHSHYNRRGYWPDERANKPAA